MLWKSRRAMPNVNAMRYWKRTRIVFMQLSTDECLAGSYWIHTGSVRRIWGPLVYVQYSTGAKKHRKRATAVPLLLPHAGPLHTLGRHQWDSDSPEDLFGPLHPVRSRVRASVGATSALRTGVARSFRMGAECPLWARDKRSASYAECGDSFCRTRRIEVHFLWPPCQRGPCGWPAGCTGPACVCRFLAALASPRAVHPAPCRHAVCHESVARARRGPPLCCFSWTHSSHHMCWLPAQLSMVNAVIVE